MLSALIAVIIIVESSPPPGYDDLWILPVSYLALYFLFLRRLWVGRAPLFCGAFLVASFVRYVVAPPIIAGSGLFFGRSLIEVEPESLESAVFLMAYELLAVSVLLWIITAWSSSKEGLPVGRQLASREGGGGTFAREQPPTASYFVYVVSAVLASALVPSAWRMFSVAIPSAGGTDYLTSPPIGEALILYGLFTAKHLGFMLLVVWAGWRYRNGREVIYRRFAMIGVLGNVLVFYGLNRSDLVFPAIATLIVYRLVFPGRTGWRKVSIIGALVGFTVVSIGSARQLASISKGRSQLLDLADFLQGYFGGVYNVSIALETSKYFPDAPNLARLAYDTARPVLGVNLFLKDSDLEFTNAFFNRRLWFGDAASQICPMVGQGVIHLGWVLAPLLDVGVVLLALALERWAWRTNDALVLYFVGMTVLRMGMFMGQNTSNMANEISMNLFLFLFVRFLASQSVRERKLSFRIGRQSRWSCLAR